MDWYSKLASPNRYHIAMLNSKTFRNTSWTLSMSSRRVSKRTTLSSGLDLSRISANPWEFQRTGKLFSPRSHFSKPLSHLARPYFPLRACREARTSNKLRACSHISKCRRPSSTINLSRESYLYTPLNK